MRKRRSILVALRRARTQVSARFPEAVRELVVDEGAMLEQPTSRTSWTKRLSLGRKWSRARVPSIRPPTTQRLPGVQYLCCRGWSKSKVAAAGDSDTVAAIAENDGR